MRKALKTEHLGEKTPETRQPDVNNRKLTIQYPGDKWPKNNQSGKKNP